jgi:ribosome-binding factor A
LSKSSKSYKLNVRHKEQSQRQLKVAQTIHTSLVECFRRAGKLDPRLVGTSLSIIEVNISPDLRVANCFFVPFNTNLSVDDLLEALEESRYVIRDYITRQVNLKYSPEIRFYFDEGSKNITLIDELLKK